MFLYPEIEKYSTMKNNYLTVSDTLFLVDDIFILINLDNVFEWNEEDIINFN